jgi:hypothetical protein
MNNKIVKDHNKLIERLRNAVSVNDACSGNLLMSNQVFSSGLNSASPEILVSLNNTVKRPHYWGHIFQQEKKYISIIIAVDYWLNPITSNELFKEFRKNLEVVGKWYPIGGNVFNINDSFEDSVTKLTNVIIYFDNTKVHGEIDSRILKIYPKKMALPQ